MKQLLAAQKKSYLDMKKTYSESQFEIRRLTRENVAMHTELQACSTIFCSADKTYRSKSESLVPSSYITPCHLPRQAKRTHSPSNGCQREPGTAAESLTGAPAGSGQRQGGQLAGFDVGFLQV